MVFMVHVDLWRPCGVPFQQHMSFLLAEQALHFLRTCTVSKKKDMAPGPLVLQYLKQPPFHHNKV
jgi:hypothetical protein